MGFVHCRSMVNSVSYWGCMMYGMSYWGRVWGMN